MRYSIMERYRKAAVRLRKQGLLPTPKAVANRLRVSQKHMHDMLNKWPELRGYAGIVSDRKSRRIKYLEAIHLLVEQGHEPTAARIAEELDMRISGVLKFHERSALDLQKPLSRREAVQKAYREAAKRIRAKGRKLTRKELAFEVGKPLSTVYQYFHSNKSFAQELGLEYTHLGHARVYEVPKRKKGT